MITRPPLPIRFANPHLKQLLDDPEPHLPPVKYQILNCQGKDILVGRLKIETPTQSGHAFILRRFDTGAISLTTMFRAAFPDAPDDEEKVHIQWVKDNYDLSGNNGSSKDAHITRLAGTWVNPKLAQELGQAYSLGVLIDAVVEASPDPNGNYRRSGKSNAATANAPAPTVVAPVVSPAKATSPEKPPSGVKSLPTPSPTAAADPPAAKRRKESSPVPITVSPVKPPSRASPVPPSPKAPPTPRRSARTKSPAPRSLNGVPPLSPAATRTPISLRSSVKQEVTIRTGTTPGGSDLATVDEENVFVEESMGAELREQDVKEQQKLIADLKAKRDAAKREEEEQDEDEDEEEEDERREMEDIDDSSDRGVRKTYASSSSSPTKKAKKRDREEEGEPLKFEFKEPEREERAIATNGRVGRFRLEPRTKSFAWGIAAFAVGMGAVTFLPSFF